MTSLNTRKSFSSTDSSRDEAPRRRRGERHRPSGSGTSYRPRRRRDWYADGVLLLDLIGPYPRVGFLDSFGVIRWREFRASVQRGDLLRIVAAHLGQRLRGVFGVALLERAGTFSEVRGATVVANTLGFSTGSPVVSVRPAGEHVLARAVLDALVALRRHRPPYPSIRPSYTGKPNIGRRSPRRVFAHESAGGFLLDQRDRVLFISRRRGAGYTIPHGDREPGETALAAARREVKEETGFGDLELLGRFPPVRYRFRSDGEWIEHREHRFVFRVRGRPKRSPERRTQRWLDLPAAIRLAPYENVRTQLRLIPQFLRARSRR